MTVGITELPPEGMQLPGVALAGDPDRGTKTTEGISLLFTTSGVTVQGPQPQIERLLVWSALDSATCREKVQLPDGRDAAIMELTSGGQSIRFLLPSDTVSPGQAAYLDQALPAWLLRYKGTTPTPPRPAPEDADRPEVGVTLPPPGPAAPAPATAAAEAAPAPPVEAPAPAYAAAGAAGLASAALADGPTGPVAAGAKGAADTNGSATGQAAPGPTGLVQPPSGQPPAPPAQPTNLQSAPAPGLAPPPPAMQAPPLAAPPAPPAPAAPTLQAPPPPPSPAAPAAPAAPAMYAPPPPAAPATPVQDDAAPTGWDDPPLGLTGHDDIAPPAHVKKPRFALTRKRLHEAEAASAGAAAIAATAAAPEAPAVGSPAPAPAPAADAPADAAPKAVKKPRFALTRKQLHAAEAAAAAGAATDAAVTPPAPAAPAPAPAVAQAPAPAADAPAEAAPKAAKKPRFALTRKQLRAAEAAAAAGAAGTTAAAVASPDAPATPAPAVAAPAAPPPPPAAASVAAPPTAPPADPVPLAVQPPAPTAQWSDAPATAPGTPDGGDPTDGPAGSSGSDGVVLAGSARKPNRRALVALVVVLVLVVAGAGYFLLHKNSSSPTVAPAANPGATGAADTALAGTINLRLTDLPSGWTTTPPAQAVVRPPVASAVAQASALNSMASCLDTSYAVVSGLFASGSLPGQTSLVQSPIFQSAAGSSFEMGSRTAVLSSAGQVQAFEGVFTNPRFDTCFQAYHQSLATAAAAGATVSVEPVTLASPKGVTTYGVVSTYTVPGSGTEVVGDAYLLGGRIVTVLQPTTDGVAIPSSVFAPAYDSVAGRVAAASTK